MDIRRGFSYSPQSRTVGPINVLKLINNRIVGVGDALPILGKIRASTTLKIGGIRTGLFLPTDKNLINFPKGNAALIKEFQAATKRSLRKRREAMTPRVRLPKTFTGLDIAKAPRIITRRFPWQDTMIRGGIIGARKGPIRKNSFMYRQQTSPTGSRARVLPDTTRTLGTVPTSASQNVLTVSVEGVKTNPRVMSTVQNEEPKVNPTLFLIAAVFIGIMVLKR